MANLNIPRRQLHPAAQYAIRQYSEPYRHRDGTRTAPLWWWRATNTEEAFRRLLGEGIIIKEE